jgi:hypothetical protein
MKTIETTDLAHVTGGASAQPKITFLPNGNPREVAMPKGLRFGGKTLPGSNGSPNVVTHPVILPPPPKNIIAM